MKYYKVIKDDQFIGAINSQNFLYYNARKKCFFRKDETRGEYVDINGAFYRDTWMVPITHPSKYEQAHIYEITEEEYNIYMDALAAHRVVTIEEAMPQPELQETASVSDIASIEYVRKSKLNEISNACHSTIINGFDLNGHHYSLDTQDQLNLMNLSIMAQTEDELPYHADGEEVTFYTADEILDIIDAANQFKIYHTTYHNALKAYVNSLETLEDIAAVTYGMEIPEEFQTDVLKTLM